MISVESQKWDILKKCQAQSINHKSSLQNQIWGSYLHSQPPPHDYHCQLFEMLCFPAITLQQALKMHALGLLYKFEQYLRPPGEIRNNPKKLALWVLKWNSQQKQIKRLSSILTPKYWLPRAYGISEHHPPHQLPSSCSD